MFFRTTRRFFTSVSQSTAFRNKQLLLIGLLIFVTSVLSAQLTFTLKPGIPTSGQIIDIQSIDGNTVFAGTGSSGLFKSTDGGATWAVLDTAATGFLIQNIFMLDNSTVFIPATGGINRSTDGGSTWTTINIPFNNVVVGKILALDANTIFVVDGNHRIFKSTDAGGTWIDINNNAIERPSRIDVIDVNNIFIGTAYKGMYKTTDGGATWIPISNGFPAADIGIFSLDAVDANTIFVGAYDNSGPNRYGLFKSTDGGANWTAINNGLDITQFQSPTVYALDANTVFSGIYGVGVVKSTDGGATWTTFSFQSGINTLVESIYVKDANTVLAGTRGGMYCGMAPCSVTDVSVSTPSCSANIVFEVAFTPLASRTGTIEVVENGVVVGSGTTSPIAVTFPDSTTSGKTFSIQYADAPNCPVTFEVLGCSNCNPNDIVISKQSQIDSFQILYGACDYIVGNLTIEDDVDGVDNITNLGGLLNLIQIGGSFICLNNPSLGGGAVARFMNNFNLQSVGGEIIIKGNPQLTSLDLLGNIANVGGAVTIEGNRALTSFGNLPNATITGTTTVSGNASVFPTPSIADPCNCNDPDNVKTGDIITFFHDVLTVTGTANAEVRLVTGGPNFLNANQVQIGNNIPLGNIPADGSPFTFDFFHPSDAAGTIVVSVGGTNLAPFSISVCSAANCTTPIPTMSEWGLLIFGLLVLNLGIFFVQSLEKNQLEV